jgi:hypothetical protein
MSHEKQLIQWLDDQHLAMSEIDLIDSLDAFLKKHGNILTYNECKKIEQVIDLLIDFINE